MKIHAIETGTVQVKERQRAGKGRGVLRFAHTLRDRNWTKPLPILAWAIEHPEGVIVVDTGETSAAMEPGYFPRWHPYYRWGVRMNVRPEEEIGPQLRALGILPRDVRLLILTHLHTDHAGGLAHFPGVETLVSAAELSAATGWPGILRGYLPHRWPEGFAPSPVRSFPEPFGPFPGSLPVTADGRVRLVPTAGHSKGQMSVVLEADGRTVFFAGDASYTKAHLEAETVDGVSTMGGGARAARETLARINRLAAGRDLVYLPSHDPESVERLAAASRPRSRGPAGGRDPGAPRAQGPPRPSRAPSPDPILRSVFL